MKAWPMPRARMNVSLPPGFAPELVELGKFRRHSGGGEMAAYPGRVLGRTEAEAGGEIESERDADGDGLAVQQRLAVAGFRLQRVAEGVAEVEQRAFAFFRFVVG